MPPKLTRAQYEQLEIQYAQTPELSNCLDADHGARRHQSLVCGLVISAFGG